jgi:hypothetical protein
VLQGSMMRQSSNGPFSLARHGEYVHLPSAEEIEDAMRVEFAKRHAAAIAHARGRAEFSRRYAESCGWPLNPRALTVKQVQLIHSHPQWLDPEGCPVVNRLFELEAVAA